MPFRLNSETPFRFSPPVVSLGAPSISHILYVPSQYPQLTDAIEQARKSNRDQLIEISSGIYPDNLSIPNKVHLTGIGEVVLSGNVRLEGEGKVSGITFTNLTLVGPRVLHNCHIRTQLSVTGTTAFFTELTSEGATSFSSSRGVFRESSLSSLSQQASLVLLANSFVEGKVELSDHSVLDAKQSHFSCSSTIFTVVDLDSTVQLINCTVIGNEKIKVGPGTSIRSNLIALGLATELIEGENIVLAPI